MLHLHVAQGLGPRAGAGRAPASPPAAKRDSSPLPQTPFRAPPRLTVTDLPRVAPEVTLSKLPTHLTVLRSLRVRSSQEVRSEHLDPQRAVSQARGVQVRLGWVSQAGDLRPAPLDV